MFSIVPEEKKQATPVQVQDDVLKQTKYKAVIQPILASTHEERAETSMKALDDMLEKEKNSNLSDSWNKLNKTIKLQKLHQFAETYGNTNKLPQKDIKSLKLYFNDCLDKNKLQRSKDLTYDKEKGIVTAVPGLTFNSTSRAFTIKSTDTKRVSSLKSLAPKRQQTPKETDDAN